MTLRDVTHEFDIHRAGRQARREGRFEEFVMDTLALLDLKLTSTAMSPDSERMGALQIRVQQLEGEVFDLCRSQRTLLDGLREIVGVPDQAIVPLHDRERHLPTPGELEADLTAVFARLKALVENKESGA